MRINQSVKRRAKMMIRDAKEKDIPRILELLKQVLQIHADIRLSLIHICYYTLGILPDILQMYAPRYQ